MIEPRNTPSINSKIVKTALTAVFSICLVILFIVSCWLISYAKRPGASGVENTVVVIPKGTSVKKISEILGKAGIIHSDIRFEVLARMYGLAGKLRAGEFVLETGRRPIEVMVSLSVAKPRLHRITFAEGLRAVDIGKRLSEGNWCNEKEFLELVYAQDFISSLGIDKADSLEGYLFPDTYTLTRYPRLSCRDIVTTMVQRFHKASASLENKYLSLHDVVILASIVEKETGDGSERPLIAGVFHNRLKRGMKLQSDPTVIYGIEDFSGDIKRSDLRRKTPYNTYVIKGLPAGPICNPGLASLQAVLQPQGDFLYFVSKNNGTHYFSKNLHEHNKAVYLYQKKKKKR